MFYGFLILAVLQVVLYKIQQRNLRKFIMATIADLNTEISGDLTDAANGIIAALKAGATPVDVQPQIDAIKAVATSLRNAVTPPAPAPTTPVPPANPVAAGVV